MELWFIREGYMRTCLSCGTPGNRAGESDLPQQPAEPVSGPGPGESFVCPGNGDSFACSAIGVHFPDFDYPSRFCRVHERKSPSAGDSLGNRSHPVPKPWMALAGGWSGVPEAGCRGFGLGMVACWGIMRGLDAYLRGLFPERQPLNFGYHPLVFAFSMGLIWSLSPSPPGCRPETQPDDASEAMRQRTDEKWKGRRKKTAEFFGTVFWR